MGPLVNFCLEFILLYKYGFTRAGPAPRVFRCEQRFSAPKSLLYERRKGPTREPQRPFFRNDARGRHRLFCVKTKARCSDRLCAQRCSIRKYATNELTHPRLIPRVPCSQGSGRTALRIAPPVSSPNSRQLGRCGQAGLALGDGGALPLALASIDFVPSTPTASPQDVFATRRRLKAILHCLQSSECFERVRARATQSGAHKVARPWSHLMLPQASRSDFTLEATYIIHHLNEERTCGLQRHFRKRMPLCHPVATLAARRVLSASSESYRLTQMIRKLHVAFQEQRNSCACCDSAAD